MVPDTHIPSGLTVTYANIQTWTEEKADTLKAHLTQNSPDVILLADIGRTDKNKPIKIFQYLVFATNKNNENSAGAAVAIRKGLDFKVLNHFNYDTIAVLVQTQSGPIILMTNYTPPRNVNLPNSDLDYAIQNNWPVLIAADMNARHSMFGYTRRSNPKGRQLNKIIFDNKLNYIGPGFPTYFSHNNTQGTKPDTVLSNNKFYFNYHIKPSGMGPSDHMTVNIRISCKPILVNCTPREDYTNTKWEQYTNSLSEIPSIDLRNSFLLEIEKEIDKVYYEINKAKSNSTPIVTIKRVRTSTSSVKFKRLTKILDIYCAQLISKGRTPFLARKIHETKNLQVAEGNALKYIWFEEQLCKVEAAAKDNSKFWRQIDRIQGKPTSQIPLLKANINGNEMEAKTQTEKVNLLTNIWSSIYEISPQENLSFCPNNDHKISSHLLKISHRIIPKCTIDLNELENPNFNLKIDIDDVKFAIKTLKDKCPGPSKLRKKHFSNLPSNVLKNLAHIFECCMAAGYYPKQFKHAHIVFIHKPGTEKHDPHNYRPISLLNTMGKIFGKILNTKLNLFLRDNNIIKESQHGFRSKRGTSTLIANMYERICREKDDKKTLITLVLRDVSKAFDKVHKDSLIYKLSKLGLPDPLLRVLSNFLQNRTAQVKINDKLGDIFNLSCGVPQGDILSPTLFLIMMNDYPQPTWDRRRKSFVMQYADDFTQIVVTKCNRINDTTRNEHRENVKEEILKQNKFEYEWKIKTNILKFKMIMIANKPKQSIIIDNSNFEYTKKAKILGLNFKCNNFFVSQVDENVKLAKLELNKLYRLRYLKKKIKVRLYKTKVLPLLTHASVPLNICSPTQMKRLQIVQNKAIRWITNTYYPNICDIDNQQEILKIEPVKERINRLAQKIWFKIETENSDFFKTTLDTPIVNGHAWFKSSYSQTFE